MLDAAEARVRAGGYDGFSFRDIAADVGIRSARAHNHFPTRAALVGALTERCARRFFAGLADAPAGPARVAGAMLLARALGDPGVIDQATAGPA